MGLTAAAVARNEQRTVRRYHLCEVVDRRAVGTATVRLTLAAPGLSDFEPLGPDEFFGLVIPRPGEPLPEPAEIGDDAWRGLAALPRRRRPDVRWYTVRHHRPERGEIDVDVVLHGDVGPASRWATRARVGDRVGMRETNAAYPPLEPGARQLIVGDETSAPAVAAILETQLLGAGTVVEAPEPASIPELPIPRGEGVRVESVVRVPLGPGLALGRVVRALPALEVDHAWLCGEAGWVRELRRHLVRDRAIGKDRITFSGYWRLGRARP